MQLFKNTASQKMRVFAFADAGHATLDPGEPVTGDAAQISAYTALDNAALGASNDAAPTEVDSTNAPGYYEFDLTQAETNGDSIEFYPKSSTAGVQVTPVGGGVQLIMPPNLPDLGIESDGDLTKVNTLDGHTAQTADHASALTAIETDTQDIQSRLPAALVGGRIDANASAISGSSTAADNAEIVFDTDFATNYDTAVDQWVIDAATLPASFNAYWGAIESYSVSSGTATTITVSGSNANDDFYNNGIMFLIGGTGDGQWDYIGDYNGTTKVFTKAGASWVVTPDGTETVYLLPGGVIPGASAPSAATVATAVMEKLIADHSSVSGSVAERLSRIPNAAAAASGGLPTVDGNNYVAGIQGTKNTLDDLNDVSAANVNTEVDNAILTYGLDHLVAASVTGTDVANNSIIAYMVSKSGTADWDDFVNTTDSLQAQADAVSGGVTVSDKTGFKLASDGLDLVTNWTVAITGNITGNLSGSVGSISGVTFPTNFADLAITSGDGEVTVGTNNDKTGYGLSSSERSSLTTAILDEANTIESAYTLRQTIEIIAAACAGKSSGHQSNAPVYRNIVDDADRITATVDANGNRTAITLNGS